MSNVERGGRREPYEFTDNERLYDRITTDRLLEIIADQATSVHSIELASNNYGEFLFVKTSRPGDQGRAVITFWGAGYHEYRERWLSSEWFWYSSPARSTELASEIEKEVALEMIQERVAEVETHQTSNQQSTRGKLFDFVADLTDDDGAIVDLEDMGEWLLGDEDDTDDQS